MTDAIDGLIWAEGLPADYREVVEGDWRPLADRLAERVIAHSGGPLIAGFNGPQGTGKSTLCHFLELLLAERGFRAVTLSLDDLYLTRAERIELARNVHPLFATRGVPGTHDVALGETILDAVTAGRATPLPRFDKAADDRSAATGQATPPLDAILFEGWCVGAAPQPAQALDLPVNRLEAEEDPDGTWRREVNRRLATDYAALFARIDWLVMLRVADFEAVRANRRLQEEKLALIRPAGEALMDRPALDRFLMHFERLTRWMLDEVPTRADIMIPIGADQRPI